MLLLKRAFLVLAAIAAVAEAVLIYRQWPSPPLKICASVEFGELLAAANKAEAQLREVRSHLRTDPSDTTTKEVMRLEASSAAAFNEVAIYKQRELEKQRASGANARSATCS